MDDTVVVKIIVPKEWFLQITGEVISAYIVKSIFNKTKMIYPVEL